MTGIRTKKEIRIAYGVSASTWSRWIKPIREQLQKIPGYNPYSKIYSPREFEIIVSHLGDPGQS